MSDYEVCSIIDSELEIARNLRDKVASIKEDFHNIYVNILSRNVESYCRIMSR